MATVKVVNVVNVKKKKEEEKELSSISDIDRECYELSKPKVKYRSKEKVLEELNNDLRVIVRDLLEDNRKLRLELDSIKLKLKKENG